MASMEHILQLSSPDGICTATLLGPAGRVLASVPVTLDVAVLEQKPGPSEYGDALVTAVLPNPVREALCGEPG